MFEKYIAAIDIGGGRWELMDDFDKLMSLPDDQIIWVDNRDDLTDELKRRYPSPDESLSFVMRHPFKSTEIDVYDSLCLANHQLNGDDIVKLAVRHNRVIVLRDLHRYIDIVLLKDTAQQHQCTVFVGSGDLIVTYNPQKIAKTKAKRKITRNDVLCLADDIERSIPYVKLDFTTSCCSTLSTSCHKCLLAIDVFNRFYGKKAHRRLNVFKEFIKLWKKHSHNNKNSFNDGESSKRFAAYITEECKHKSNGKLRNIPGEFGCI